MLTQNSPVCIYDFTATLSGVFALLPKIRIDKRRVIAVRHKANLLAIVFRGYGKPQLSCELAHFRFHKPSQRKSSARKLLLRQAEQEIRLILGSVYSGPHLVTVRIFVVADPRI